MVVALGVFDRDLDRDPPEERGGRMEDEPVRARLERAAREVCDAPVLVRLLAGDELAASIELDADAARGLSPLGVEDVRRDGRRPPHSGGPLY